MSKQLYEVRVREVVGKDNEGRPKYQKKSRFYWAANAGDAAGKYKGTGHFMWANKVSKEKLLGVGQFFTLGNELLREFRGEEKRRAAERHYLNEKKREVRAESSY